ncbi:unnamed protein product, partial [Didymodactylos carnosus]
MGVDPSQVRSSINNIIVYLQRHAKSFNGMKKRLQNTKERLQKTETDIAMSKMLVMASDVADLYIRYCALRVLRSRGITASNAMKHFFVFVAGFQLLPLQYRVHFLVPKVPLPFRL